VLSGRGVVGGGVCNDRKQSKGVFPAGGGAGMLTVRRMQQAVQSKARQTESGKCKLGEKQQTTTTRKKM